MVFEKKIIYYAQCSILHLDLKYSEIFLSIILCYTGTWNPFGVAVLFQWSLFKQFRIISISNDMIGQ